MSKKAPRYVYCPLHEETGCGYWGVFGGHLDIFIKGFKAHIKKHHSDLPEGLRRDRGGKIDRWIGDLIVETFGREWKTEKSQ